MSEPEFLSPDELRALDLRRAMCCWCGLRMGMHRYGDNKCPNPARKDSNGVPAWATDTRFARKAFT